MPLVKQRDLLLMGNFSFDVNAQIKHDKWFNNAPWGAGALAWGGPFLEAAEKLPDRPRLIPHRLERGADLEAAHDIRGGAQVDGARAAARDEALEFRALERGAEVVAFAPAGARCVARGLSRRPASTDFCRGT